MGITLYSTQSEENRRLKAGKTGPFLIDQPIPHPSSLYTQKKGTK